MEWEGLYAPTQGVNTEQNARIRGYASLRRFRESKPEADYFLTLNLQARGRGLEAAGFTNKIRMQREKLESEGW